MNFPNDGSTQIITTLTPSGTYNPIITSNSLATSLALKQDTLTASTTLLGVGSVISALDYNKITLNKPTNFQADWNSTVINRPTYFQADWNSTVINRPTNFQADWNSTIINKPTTFNPDLTNIYTKTETNNLLNAKQNLLNNNTILSGIGSNLTLINYNTLSNLPDLSSYLTTANASTTYATITNLNLKENALTFSSPLTRTNNDIGINLSSYSTTGNDANYLLKSGGTMTGSLTINGTNQILSFGSRLQDNIIRLYGTVFGFGINDFTLRYNANNTHKFYCDNILRGTIDPNGISGSGANITNLNYNNITTNKPDLTIYTTTTALNSCNYLTTTNASSTYQPILTFNSPMSKTGNTVSINLSAYLPLSGGTLTGALTFAHSLWNKSSDNIDRFYFNNSGTTFIHAGNGTYAFRNTDNNIDNFVINNTSVNINNNGNLIFNDTTADMRLQLYTGYGFGINTSTLRYNTAGRHAFFINNGEIIRFTSVGMGFGNTNPQSYLHLGNCDLAGSSPVLLFGKRLSDNSGFRTAFLGYNDAFYFCIGDAGNINNTVSTTQQFRAKYSAPVGTLTLEYDGKCYSLQFINTSDEKIKTDIETIDNALWKVQQLRGVSYKNIQEDFKAIGLIAQEVENIIPEAVSTNNSTGLKGIDYSGLVGLLINAIKEQQEQINFILSKIKNE